MRKIEFTLNEAQEEKLRIWYELQNKKAAKLQVDSGELKTRPELEKDVIRQQKPYSGITSAGPIWILSQCGIGTSIVVKHWYTNEELDLTDYDNW